MAGVNSLQYIQAAHWGKKEKMSLKISSQLSGIYTRLHCMYAGNVNIVAHVVVVYTFLFHACDSENNFFVH